MHLGQLPDVPYRLERRGVLMRRDPGSEWEKEGVLNPASAQAPDGSKWLLPRLVGPGNESRVGLAQVVIEHGEPVAATREGVVLEPDAHWERAPGHAGVEDPRVTWVATLGHYIMAYVAYGPLGPRPALAVSRDLRQWVRLGPIHFEYDAVSEMDLNVFDNKDAAFFPEPVPDPEGRPSYALLHRPMWDDRPVFGGGDSFVPSGLSDVGAAARARGNHPGANSIPDARLKLTTVVEVAPVRVDRTWPIRRRQYGPGPCCRPCLRLQPIGHEPPPGEDETRKTRKTSPRYKPWDAKPLSQAGLQPICEGSSRSRLP